MKTPYEIMLEAQSLEIHFTEEDGKLIIDAPKGAMTVELYRSLKEYKSDILYLLSLPEPAKPGAEVEELRRKIGEMVRQEHVRCEHGA